MAIFREPPQTAESEAPAATDKGTDVGETPQWKLMVRRFKQSKLAVAGGIVLLFMYIIAALAPFISPNDPGKVDTDRNLAPPTQFTWDGGLAMCVSKQVQRNFRYVTVTDCDNPVKVQWFGKGPEYTMLGFIKSDIHLMAVPEKHKLLLWGADDQGRDVFSRTIHGGQVSLTVGLVGVGIATILATVIGTISGYFAGVADNIIQRIIEIISSVPTLPLWAALAAILPHEMPVAERYFFITLILSLVAWAGLARQVRGKVMAFAGADYVHAARAAGSGHTRIILTHMVPNSISHVIVVAMLAIPGTIIAETSLSFLGIGMLEPAISWGVLLEAAQEVNVVTTHPWMLIPAVAVIVTVTAYQLLGDGIRDAVDPYG